MLLPAQNPVDVTVDATNQIAQINPNVYGHFSEHLGRCIYGGLFVGKDSKIPNTDGVRNDIIEALKRIKIPNLRWPGGCFADEYHWMDGIGPVEGRPKMINTHWGGVVEDNSFGTHEFLNMCEVLGAEPYISANVGSGSVEEMSKWVEYMTSDNDSPMANLRKENGRDKPWKVKYFGVGNENWGCGGNMTPEYYSSLYRRYQTYCRNYGDNTLFKIACGPNRANYNWMKVVMESVPTRLMNGISLHHYTFPNGFAKKGPATGFTEDDYAQVIKQAMFMDELIRKHTAIMDAVDPLNQVALIVDEWGTWFTAEPGTHPRFLYQQNTMRDALVAAITFNIFHKYAHRVQMANIAQLVNVLQALFLTQDEKMILTPTYHIFDMYKVHQGSIALATSVAAPNYIFGENESVQVSASASVDLDGNLYISLANVDPKKDAAINCSLVGFKAKSIAEATILNSKEVGDYNSFEQPDKIKPAKLTGASIKEGNLKLTLPAHSIVTLTLKK